MRLTNKNGDNYIFAWQFDKNLKALSKKKIFQNIANKLGQLEDIEEELGIDLITFFKYLFADKFYVKDKYLGIVERLFWSISRNYVEVVEEKYPYGDCTETLNFKDYGKTWALTKEELK